MNGREFVRLARRYARRNGLEFSFDPSRGKGSHGEVRIGEFKTITQHGEIKEKYAPRHAERPKESLNKSVG